MPKAAPAPTNLAFTDDEDPGLPVYMCLDGDIIRADNRFSYYEALRSGLKAMHALGVSGVVVEVFWGVVEAAGPREYDWSTYQHLVQLLQDEGFVVQVALCFNSNDTVPLPPWVMELGSKDPDIFFTDKQGARCTECLSLGIDELPVLHGRTALEVYRDFVASFRAAFDDVLGTTITDVLIGLGPDGELKYPAHPTRGDKRWTFPGIGEFQCYDKYLLSHLKACAHHFGQPSWGLGGPHDAGSYCQWPHQTGFFHQHGSWAMPYGKFFLQWYSEMLVHHGDLVLGVAREALCGEATKGMPPAPGAPSVSSSGVVAASRGCPVVSLHARLPGMHWWYNTASHAPELTAGYYNTAAREGYLPVMSMLGKHGVGVRLRSAELRNHELMPQALCDPEKQLALQRTVAAALLVPVSLDNLTVRFDEGALNRLEGALFDASVYQGVELPQVTGLVFNKMCDGLFEPGNWTRFKDFIRRVRNRADVLVVHRPLSPRGAAAAAHQQQQQQAVAASLLQSGGVQAQAGSPAPGGALQLA